MCSVSIGQHILFERLGVNLCSISEVACRGYLGDLDRNLTPLVFPFPYFGKPAVAQRGIRTIVAERDLY